MILSAPEIVRRLDKDRAQGNLVITPYSRDCQQPASYDLRSAGDMLLPKGSCTLVPTLEWIELPMDLAGHSGAGHHSGGVASFWVRGL